MAFNLFSGNRLEDLAATFIFRRREKLPELDVFASETVVVQTRGMAVWLTRRLAEHSEISANINFPFLQKFVDGVLIEFGGNATEIKLFDPGVLTWRIAHILLANGSKYPELAHYLTANPVPGENYPLKIYRLSRRIARVFDRYQLYMPEMLARWQYETPLDSPGDWQAKLWRELTDDGKIKSRADLLVAMLKGRKTPQVGTVDIFGVGVMSPWYLKFFRKLSTANEVNFFYLNPCAEYWADHPVKFELGKRDFVPPPEELMNPLLASWGLQGREFFKRIVDLDEEVGEEAKFHFWSEPGDGKATLLETVKGHIVRVATPEAGEKIVIRTDDDSITFHSCAGPGRMLEVLHDRLLYLIEKHSYSLNDIVVMSPAIDELASYIRAIFDRGEFKNRYAISDRTVRNGNVLAGGFFSLLELATGRFESSNVIGILFNEPLKRKFGFSDGDLEIVSQWVARANIRWGIDGAMRCEIAGVEFDEFSWRSGLNRMLLGVAFDDDENRVDYPDGVIPLNCADSGEKLEVLGSLCRFIRLLGEVGNQIVEAKSGDEWLKFLNRVLDDFFLADDEDAEDFASLRRSFEELAANIALAKYDALVDFEQICESLSGALEKPGGRDPFFAGKITFSSLMPLRSVPGKVVVLLGMDDGVFPRQDREESFDLSVAKLDCSAGSGRWEDNYLFLEALLAAREKLLIFFRGEDDRKLRQYPPALPVAELYQYIGRIAENPKKIWLEHSLQPFDPGNFSAIGEVVTGVNSKFSYSRTLLKLANGNPKKTEDFVAGVVGMEVSESRRILLRELERFFEEPARVFWEKHLQSISYSARDAKLDDEETLRPGYLEHTILLRKVAGALACGLDSEAEEKLYRRLKGESFLPPGGAGRIYFRELELDGFIEDPKIRQCWANREKIDCAVTLSDSVELSGILELTPEHDGIIDCCFARLKGRNLINFSLRHLLLSASSEKSVKSLLLGRKRGEIFSLGAIDREKAVSLLEELYALYLEGLSSPLPFFARSSIAEVLNPGKGKDEFKSDCAYGEYTSMFFGTDYLDDPQAEENFVMIAHRAFGWLLDYVGEGM